MTNTDTITIKFSEIFINDCGFADCIVHENARIWMATKFTTSPELTDSRKKLKFLLTHNISCYPRTSFGKIDKHWYLTNWKKKST